MPTASWKPKAKPPFEGSRPGSVPATTNPISVAPTAPHATAMSSGARKAAASISGTITSSSGNCVQLAAASANSVLAPMVAASRASRLAPSSPASEARDTIISTGNSTAKPSPSPATQRQNVWIGCQSSDCATAVENSAAANDGATDAAEQQHDRIVARPGNGRLAVAADLADQRRAGDDGDRVGKRVERAKLEAGSEQAVGEHRGDEHRGGKRRQPQPRIPEQDRDRENVGKPKAGDAVVELQVENRDDRPGGIAGGQQRQNGGALQLDFFLYPIRQCPAPKPICECSPSMGARHLRKGIFAAARHRRNAGKQRHA